MEGFNIGNIFRPSSGTPATNGALPTGAPASPGTPASGTPNDPARGLDLQNPGAGGTGTPNGGGAITTEGAAQGSPLDAFKDLFKIDDKKTPPKDPLAEPLLKLDPKTLAEAVNKMDFARTLPPDLVAKALAGDGVAFSTALNGVARASFMQLTQMFTQLMEGAIKTNNSRYDGVLGDRFRNFQINSSSPENKALQHPAAKPVVDALKTTIASQHPDLSAGEVQKKAEEYFLAMNKEINSLETDANKGAGGGAGGGGNTKDQDWTSYL